MPFKLSSRSFGYDLVSGASVVDFERFLLSLYLTSTLLWSSSSISSLIISSCIFAIVSIWVLSSWPPWELALLSIASYLYTISLTDFDYFSSLSPEPEYSSDDTFLFSPALFEGWLYEPLPELLKNDDRNSFAFRIAYSSTLMPNKILYWSMSTSGRGIFKIKFISSSVLSRYC